MKLILQRNSMGLAASYLQKHAFREPLIDKAPDPNLKIFVAIPAYNESGLIKCLDSLFNTDSVEWTFAAAEVIVVINLPEDASAETIELNRRSYEEALQWVSVHERADLRFHIAWVDELPKKHFGAGLARKLAMDEGVWRQQKKDELFSPGAVGRAGDLSEEKEKIAVSPGLIIASLDADTTVKKNYLNALLQHFEDHPKASGCTIDFRHPPEGSEYSEEVYRAIKNYEDHLRYYLRALRHTGYPYAFHTVGSAFAVRLEEYCRQGGMSKRQAGEDFYFIQKVAMHGNFTECHTTEVYPSPRPSDRVPFGTGPEVRKQLDNPGKAFLTYNPLLFEQLKEFYSRADKLFLLQNPGRQPANLQKDGDETEEHGGNIEAPGPKVYDPGRKAELPVAKAELPVAKAGDAAPEGIDVFLGELDPMLRKFLEKNNFADVLTEIRANSSSEKTFRQRFLRKFNLFWILKYLHFAEENGVEKVRLESIKNRFL